MSEEMRRDTSNTRQMYIAVAVLILGVLGDMLLRGMPWGLNVALMTLATFALLIVVVYIHNATISATARLFLGVVALFGMCFLWRDAVGLKLLNLCIMFGAVGLAARSELGPGLIPKTRLGTYLGELANSAMGAFAVPTRTLPGVARWFSVSDSLPRRNALGVARGLLMTAGLFTVFGLLFASADATFERAAARVLDFDLPKIISHAIGIVICMWFAAAFFLQVLEPRYRKNGPPPIPKQSKLGAVELNFSLAMLNALFISFVLIQLSYFFGGHEHVLAESGLTYAEYARRGFFELASVSGLVLVVLLVWESQLHDASRSATFTFRLLGGSLIALVLIIIASAMHRMGLYTEAYGLTTMRLYVSTFMIWMLVVFAWFSFTVLQGKADRFPPGFIASGLLAAFVLLAINPHGLVARHNVARFAEGKSLDIDYLTSLSADAVPVMVKTASTSDAPELRSLVYELNRRWLDQDESDWRSWNWGRSRALAHLHASEVHVTLSGLSKDTETEEATAPPSNRSVDGSRRGRSR